VIGLVVSCQSILDLQFWIYDLLHPKGWSFSDFILAILGLIAPRRGEIGTENSQRKI
jgi:hypothetical protein